jgi:class IIb bacteriocin, lactobin A/cerein 7B family
MKTLTTNEVQAVSGGWGPAAAFIGGAAISWAAGEYIFSPMRDALVRGWNKHIERGEAMAEQCRSDPGVCASRYSFYGDW